MPAMRTLCTSVRARGLSDRRNCRNPTEDANQTRKTTTGVSTASPNAAGGLSGAFTKRCCAEADRVKTNQAARSPELSLAYLDMANLLIRDFQIAAGLVRFAVTSLVRFKSSFQHLFPNRARSSCCTFSQRGSARLYSPLPALLRESNRSRRSSPGRLEIQPRRSMI